MENTENEGIKKIDKLAKELYNARKNGEASELYENNKRQQVEHLIKKYNLVCDGVDSFQKRIKKENKVYGTRAIEFVMVFMQYFGVYSGLTMSNGEDMILYCSTEYAKYIKVGGF